ncbi:MAG: hypothetical protein Q7R57_10375 [Dehalococcoidales bacterium]|nr:hypothetical protein [Dehalococcoidales bacterium]
MSSKRKFWLAGIVLAGAGVVLARVVSSRFNQPLVEVVLYGVGILLALAGLGIIMYAIKKGLE